MRNIDRPGRVYNLPPEPRTIAEKVTHTIINMVFLCWAAVVASCALICYHIV